MPTPAPSTRLNAPERTCSVIFFASVEIAISTPFSTVFTVRDRALKVVRYHAKYTIFSHIWNA